MQNRRKSTKKELQMVKKVEKTAEKERRRLSQRCSNGWRIPPLPTPSPPSNHSETSDHALPRRAIGITHVRIKNTRVYSFSTNGTRVPNVERRVHISPFQFSQYSIYALLT